MKSPSIHINQFYFLAQTGKQEGKSTHTQRYSATSMEIQFIKSILSLSIYPSSASWCMFLDRLEHVVYPRGIRLGCEPEKARLFNFIFSD